MANKGEIRIDGKVMGKDYGRYFYSPRGNMSPYVRMTVMMVVCLKK